MTICRKVIEVSGAGLVEGATKTKAGRRTVTLPRRVMTEVEAHRAAFPSTSLISTSPDGAQVRATSGLEVAKWAGHGSAAFTKSRHAHPFPEHGEALADRLDAFIAASTATPAAAIIDLGRFLMCTSRAPAWPPPPDFAALYPLCPAALSVGAEGLEPPTPSL